MARRTKDEAQATREHLINTAEQVFLARGVARSSLQDIAEAAGLTRGAIYWHFADKPALFNAMMARVDLPLEQALAAAELSLRSPAGAAAAPEPTAVLRALALAPFALMQRDPRARRVFTILLHRTEFLGDMAALVTRQDGALSDCVQQMARLFTAVQAQGLLAPAVSPSAAAIALVALIDGLLRLCTLAAAVGATADANADATADATAKTTANTPANTPPAGSDDPNGMHAAVQPAIDALLRGLRTAA